MRGKQVTPRYAMDAAGRGLAAASLAWGVVALGCELGGLVTGGPLWWAGALVAVGVSGRRWRAAQHGHARADHSMGRPVVIVGVWRDPAGTWLQVDDGHQVARMVRVPHDGPLPPAAQRLLASQEGASRG